MTELKGKKEREKKLLFFWFPSEISSVVFFLNHIQGMSRKEGSNQINGNMVRDNVRHSICADSATSVLLKSLISMQCWSCVTDLCHLDQPLTFRLQMEHFSKQREHFYGSAWLNSRQHTGSHNCPQNPDSLHNYPQDPDSLHNHPPSLTTFIIIRKTLHDNLHNYSQDPPRIFVLLISFLNIPHNRLTTDSFSALQWENYICNKFCQYRHWKLST